MLIKLVDLPQIEYAHLRDYSPNEKRLHAAI